MQDERAWEYCPVKVNFVIFFEFFLCEVYLSLVSESLEVLLLKQLQIYEVDVLEEDDHGETGDEVFREEVRDWPRSKLELEPVFLVIDWHCEVLVY